MTTITPFAAGSYVTNRNTSQLLGLKSQLNDLSTQLSTGLTAQTYGGLGTGRSTALAAQATLSALTGYAAGITAAQTRTNVAVTSLTQVATLGTDARTTLNNGLQSTPVNTTAAKSIALGNLQTALDTLNQSVAGNYLFGGGNSTTQPVLDADTILNGTVDSKGNKLDGLTDVIKERVDAQLGKDGNGRLTQSASTVIPIQVTEEANAATRGTFGFTLGENPTATGAFSAAVSDTSPATLTVNLSSPTAQPAIGDSISFSLNMPDGTSTTVTLTAATSADPSSTTSFAIGSSAADTMKNLSSTLTNALKGAASSTLAVSATADAATQFFSGSANGGPDGNGVIPQRVLYDGANPIGYASPDPNETVLWYQGENTYSTPTDPTAQPEPTPALDSQSVQVSATGSVGTGARADDKAIQNVLAGLATIAFALPTTSDANTNATYQTVISRAGALLSSSDQTSPSVQDTVSQLSIAATRLSNASTTNTATQNTLKDTLDGIEQAPTEEVVAKLLDVQNRLQASYQLTSSLSKLSLVNYLS